jgi:hypothetical protein
MVNGSYRKPSGVRARKRPACRRLATSDAERLSRTRQPPVVGNAYPNNDLLDDREPAFQIVGQSAGVVEVVRMQPHSRYLNSEGSPREVDCQGERRPSETVPLSIGHQTERDNLDFAVRFRAQCQQSPRLPVDIDEPVPRCRCRPVAGPTLSRPQMRVADLVKDPHDHRVVLINGAKMHPWVWVRSHQLIMRAHLQRQPRLVDVTHGGSLAGQHRSSVQVPQADRLASRGMEYLTDIAGQPPYRPLMMLSSHRLMTLARVVLANDVGVGAGLPPLTSGRTRSAGRDTTAGPAAPAE